MTETQRTRIERLVTGRWFHRLAFWQWPGLIAAQDEELKLSAVGLDTLKESLRDVTERMCSEKKLMQEFQAVAQTAKAEFEVCKAQRTEVTTDLQNTSNELMAAESRVADLTTDLLRSRLDTNNLKAELAKTEIVLERTKLDAKSDREMHEATRGNLMRVMVWIHATHRLAAPPGGIRSLLARPAKIAVALLLLLPTLLFAAGPPPPLLRNPYTTNGGSWSQTNVISLSTTNLTSKPLTNHYRDGVLTLYGLEAGANVTLTVNGSNIVITSTGGGGTGLTTNTTQFGPSVELTIKNGAFLTNMNYWGTGTNQGTLWMGADLLPLVVNAQHLGNNSFPWEGVRVQDEGVTFIASGGGPNFVGIIAPTTVNSTYTMSLPPDPGTVGQVITNDGTQLLGWWNPYFGNTNLYRFNANQFQNNSVTNVNVKPGAFQTNMNFWGIGTNHSQLWLDGGLFPLSGNNYSLGSSTVPFFSLTVQDGGVTLLDQAAANSVGLLAPSAVSVSYSMQLPTAQGGNGQVITNDGAGLLGWWTPAGGVPGLTTNVNQFLGVPLSIRAGALLTNVVIQQSNNTSVSLLVTNNPGSVQNLIEAYNTNRSGFVVRSNGVMDIRANVVSGTNQTLIVDNNGASGQTYVEIRNGGTASFVQRGDSAGNAVFSSMGVGDFYFNYDGGSGNIHWGTPGVGDVLRFIGSSSVYALHGQSLRRLQLTNVWDIFCRSNITWNDTVGAAQVSLQSTSGMTSYTMFLPITNGLAGQLLYNAGGGALGWTNDNTSAGASGASTNANQFGVSSQLTIKKGGYFTNSIFFEDLAAPASAIVVTQAIGSGTNVFMLVASNGEPAITVTSNTTLKIKALTGLTNDPLVVAYSNNTARLNVRTNGLTVASNVVVYPIGDEVGVMYRLFSMTNQSVLTNKTTDASIISNITGRITLPADWWTVGKSLHMVFRGSSFSAATPGTCTNSVTFGGTQIATNLIPLIASENGDAWDTTIDVVCRNVGANGTLYCQGQTEIPSSSGGSSMVGRAWRMASGAVTVNTTTAGDIDVHFHPNTSTESLIIKVGYAYVIP